jgi:hypothetical protein
MAFDQEALIRSIAVASKPRYMLLLGAGASATSGIPTASQCIWEWKREIYLSGNPSFSPSLFLDVSLPSVQQRIQGWLDLQRRFPALGDRAEYGFYVEYAYPKVGDRQTYFEKRFSGVVPQIGYRLLAMLQNSFTFQWTWTTNFDGLVRQARTPGHARPLKEVGLDTTFRLRDLPEDEQCAYLVYLHGDYRYDKLQNTSVETQALDTVLRGELIERVRRQPLIVLGYGGRDESVMTALESAVTTQQSSGGGLYWCLVRDEAPNPRVTRLVDTAKASGLESDIISIDGFDDLMVRLARHVYREAPEAVQVERLLESALPEKTAFAFVGYSPEENWLKSNGYPIDLPRQLYQFEVDGIVRWRDLREILKTTEAVAGPLKGKVLAIGDATEIANAFRGRLKTKIELVPLAESDFNRPDTVTVSVLVSALQRGLASAVGLMAKGRATLWDSTKHEVATFHGLRHKAYPAVRLSVNEAAGRHFLNLVPDLHVTLEDGAEAGVDAVKDVKRQLLGKQWNSLYYDVLEGWKARLFGSEKSCTFRYPPGSQSAFAFTLSLPPAYARLLAHAGRAGGKATHRKAAEQFDAIVLDEPALVFGSALGHPSPKDRHPIRGLINDGPYDLQLTKAGLCSEVRLGIVCDEAHAPMLSNYLANLFLPHSSVESKREYLLAYPGFQQAYRIPLRVPPPGSREWRALPELAVMVQDPVSALRTIAGAVTREIDSLISLASVDVVMVFVPSDWAPFERVDDGTISLNLHDHIKAYCAQKGIRTQLLREGTLDKPHQCEVLWWLAQAIYVKSLRTPFLLAADDRDAVFVGIGYGFSKNRTGGLVLGCSHIYDAAGQGMRYQLSRIQSPIWRHENPFLSKDDAIRVGLQARQLFFETYHRLPRRVVIHKRTPFLGSEREGLAHALKGVEELEMLAVQEEDAWRFIAYNKSKKGPDAFPVKRGSLLLLGRHEFFLWVHGSIKGMTDDNRSYYQGKSRIPVPLKVTRFAGRSSIELVASEILGLSKMNWNSYDLYSQMPATLESSSAIARIGQLLARFGPETLDYRLFM